MTKLDFSKSPTALRHKKSHKNCIEILGLIYLITVLDSTDGSAGIDQGDNGGHGKHGVEGVNQKLGVFSSQPERLGRVLVTFL